MVQSGRVSTPHHVQQSAIKDVQVQPKRSAIKDMQDESPRSAIKDSQVATLAAHWQYTGDIKAWVYDMKEDTESCDKRYLELAKIPESKLHSRQVPCIDDHQLFRCLCYERYPGSNSFACFPESTLYRSYGKTEHFVVSE